MTEMPKRLITKKFFVELCSVEEREKFDPQYTMAEKHKELNGKKYLSMYQLYMESADEYEFAMNVLGSTTHWERLLQAGWFYDGYRNHKGIEKWREDMRARDESLAKKVLLTAAKSGDINAAKKLFDTSKPKSETKRGRFVKQEAIKEAAKKSEDKEFLDSAVKRLNVVNIQEKI